MRFDTSSQDSSEAARWRRIRRAVIQRTAAVATGIVLCFSLAFALDGFANNSLLPFFACYIAAYSVAGLLFGLVWPNSGWRLGLYLNAVWPPIIVAWFVLTDPPPVINWRELILHGMLYLTWLLLTLAGAMGGGGAGSRIRRGMSGDISVRVNDSIP